MKVIILVLLCLALGPLQAQSLNPIGPWGKLKDAEGKIFAGNGAVLSIDFHPRENKTIYMGTYGGLWKTTNGGDSWHCLTKGQLKLNTIVNSIQTSKKDSEVIYLATGDPTKIRLHHGPELYNPYSSGIYRSLDGGQHWQAINDGLPNFISDSLPMESGTGYRYRGHYVLDLCLCPFDPNLLLAATSQGVYYCRNALAHQPQWNRIKGLPNNSFRSIKFSSNAQSNQYELYVSGNSIVARAKNQLEQWETLLGPGSGANLSQDSLIRTQLRQKSLEFADYYVQPSLHMAGDLYALASFWIKDSVQNGYHAFLLHYSARNNTWKALLDDRFMKVNEDYGGCLSRFAISPYSGQFYFPHKTLKHYDPFTGNQHEFSPLTYWTYQCPNAHADSRAIAFSPHDSCVYIGNDAFLSVFEERKASYDCSAYRSIRNDSLNIGRISHLSASPTQPGHYLAGLWDNFCVQWKQGKTAHPGKSGSPFGLGDGYFALILNDSTLFMNSSRLRASSPFPTSPGSMRQAIDQTLYEHQSDVILRDPVDPDLFYYTGNRISKMSEQGTKKEFIIHLPTLVVDGKPLGEMVWNANRITAMAIAPSNPQVMYAALSPALNFRRDPPEPYTYEEKNQTQTATQQQLTGSLWVTRNGGAENQWRSIPLPYTDDRITGLTVDPDNADVFYIAYGGRHNRSRVFRYQMISDTQYIYKDYNQSTQLPIRAGINCMVMEKENPGGLFLGTDAGVFYTHFKQKSWRLLEDSLSSHCTVTDLDITYAGGQGRLLVATWGAGVWELNLKKEVFPQSKKKTKSTRKRKRKKKP